MPTNYKYFQVQGTANTSTYATLYPSPAATQAVISTISICNTAATAATYRIGIMSTAGTPGASQFIISDAQVGANDTVFLTLGICMPASNFIRVSSSATTVAFNAFVAEIT